MINQMRSQKTQVTDGDTFLEMGAEVVMVDSVGVKPCVPFEGGFFLIMFYHVLSTNLQLWALA